MVHKARGVGELYRGEHWTVRGTHLEVGDKRREIDVDIAHAEHGVVRQVAIGARAVAESEPDVVPTRA